MELVAKPKLKRGRPQKHLNPDRAFDWFDELEYNRALQDRKDYLQELEDCKVISGTDFDNIKDFESDLRSKYPDLKKLGIEQLYILDGKNQLEIEKAFLSIKSMSGREEVLKESYTIRIPAEKANEYSQYLAIAQAFNNIRESGNNQLNTAQIPIITGNRIILDNRSMKLVPNAYRFTKSFQQFLFSSDEGNRSLYFVIQVATNCFPIPF